MSSQSASAPSITVGPLVLERTGDPGAFEVGIDIQVETEGVYLVELTLTAAQAATPPAFGLRFDLPARDIHARWLGNHTRNRGLVPDWGSAGHVQGRACSAAPVLCLHSAAGRNRLTMAVSDAIHPTLIGAGLREESAAFVCTLQWNPTPRAATTHQRELLRLDLRDVPMPISLDACAQWWSGMAGLAALPVPDAGRLPMYSTWYSFHQAVDPDAVERQCVLAKALGCGAVIVDDGWQTLDGNRGYAFCGDWRPDRIPDLAGHVRRIHDLGMQFLLWYSVPFIGRKSQAYARFEGRYLREDLRLDTAVLDPRFAEVRGYLIDTYDRAVQEWDLDGLKLDFVDAFSLPEHASPVADGGRDHADVDEAVACLLTDTVSRLRQRKPELLFEFRQSYIGPFMRTVGNLFRAGDCPNDAIGNRLRVLDIRLLCAETACHSDMLMWHPSDPVESAALQLLNVLYSVPQISVLLDRIPADHQAMLAFWLPWWIAHRTTLLDGELDVAHPELGYTRAAATAADEHIASAYMPTVVPLVDRPYLAVVNATRSAGLVVQTEHTLGRRRVRVRNCCGQVVDDREVALTAGVHALPIPPAGLAEILA